MRLSKKEIDEIVLAQVEILARETNGLTSAMAKKITHRMEVICVKIAEKFRDTTGIDIEWVV